MFRRFFETIVEQCIQAKLVWGRELYVDATKVNANADLDSLVPRFAVEAREAHLAALFAEQQDEAPPEPPDSAGQSDATPSPLPVSLPDALREELTEENAARHDWIAEEGRPDREVHGVYQRVADVRISTTDPDATPMRLKGGGTHLGYQVHYLLDGGKRRIILGALVTPGEVRESQPMLDLLWQVRFRWHLHPRLVSGDTKYGTIENIRAVEEAGIRAYMALPNWEERSEVWSSSHFQYEAEADQYRCPAGQVLPRMGWVKRTDGRRLYQGVASVCQACRQKRAVYDQSHGAAGLPLGGRGVSGAGADLSPDGSLPEGDAQAAGVD